MNKAFLAMVAAALLLIPSLAISDNVAFNANVTLNGTFFTGGWGSGLTVLGSTLVDDVFFPRSTQWDQGAVWWDSHNTTGQSIIIDLGGTYTIDSFIVQADDNDAYKLYYRDLGTSSWLLAWDIPVVGGWGMQTRPNVLDDSERYFLPALIVTNALMFEGDLQNSDRYFSVSEIQAFGVPEPATLLFLGFGLLGLLGLRKRS